MIGQTPESNVKRKIKGAIIYVIAVLSFKNNSEKRKLHQQHKHDNVCNCVVGDVCYISINPKFAQQR